MRAVIELLVTLLVIFVARAIFTSVLKGVASASANAARSQPSGNSATGSNGNPGGTTSSTPKAGGDLHKDPVCGTYVSESTPYRRANGRETFFYCSEACREKHSLVAR